MSGDGGAPMALGELLPAVRAESPREALGYVQAPPRPVDEGLARMFREAAKVMLDAAEREERGETPLRTVVRGAAGPCCGAYLWDWNHVPPKQVHRNCNQRAELGYGLCSRCNEAERVMRDEARARCESKSAPKPTRSSRRNAEDE